MDKSMQLAVWQGRPKVIGSELLRRSSQSFEEVYVVLIVWAVCLRYKIFFSWRLCWFDPFVPSDPYIGLAGAQSWGPLLSVLRSRYTNQTRELSVCSGGLVWILVLPYLNCFSFACLQMALCIIIQFHIYPYYIIVWTCIYVRERGWVCTGLKVSIIPTQQLFNHNTAKPPVCYRSRQYESLQVAWGSYRQHGLLYLHEVVPQWIHKLSLVITVILTDIPAMTIVTDCLPVVNVLECVNEWWFNAKTAKSRHFESIKISVVCNDKK